MVKLRKILIFVAVPLIVFAAAYLITQAAPTCGTGGSCSLININNGVVGINTTTPAAMMDIFSSSSIPIGLRVVNSAGTTVLEVNNSGKVGINNPSPNYALDVSGDSNVSGNSTIGGILTVSDAVTAPFFNGSLNASYVAQGNFGSNVGGGNYSFPGVLAVNTSSPYTGFFYPQFQVYGAGKFYDNSDANANVQISGATGAGGDIAFGGSNGLGTSILNYNGDLAFLNNSGGGTFGVDQGGNGVILNSLVIGTTTTSTATFKVMNASSSNALVVAPSGNVSLGISNPLGNLSISNMGWIDQGMYFDSASAPINNTSTVGLVFDLEYHNGQYATRFVKVDRGFDIPLYVQETQVTANSWSNIARFGSGKGGGNNAFEVFGNTAVTGNVGIGTALPSDKLEVNGNALVDGVIKGQYTAGAGDVLWVGNDSKLVDINVANTMGVEGLEDSTVGSIQLGNGSWSSGKSTQITMGDTNHYISTTWGLGMTIFDTNGVTISSPVNIHYNSATGYALNTINTTVGGGGIIANASYADFQAANFTGGNTTYGFLCASGVGACTVSLSDQRLKKDVNYMIPSSALSQLMDLKPTFFRWKQGNQRLQTGFIAQDVLPIMPNLV
ncbi:tail fiber domain-containing protein, partial [Patescibacteria group bacterium]|nr:tail fiber domain-containing protein [Patescibacteria group bacterium]